MGIASLLQRPLMGSEFKKANLINTWANEDAVNKIEKYYNNASGADRKEKIYNTFRDQLGDLVGIDGKETKDFADILKIPRDTSGKFIGNIGNEKIHNAVNELVNLTQTDKYNSKAFKKAYKDIVGETLIAENIKFKGDKGFFSNNLESLCEDTVKMLRGVVKADINDADKLTKYFNKSKKLVNWKSIGGLGVIIPLALSMQSINRWITYKQSGRKGAPIYKDFGKDSEHKELSSKDKKELLAQKFVSIGSMIGVCGLSMFMDRPVWKNIFQFKGIFPTMDQARIISTATFASRMAVSEDKNELREATVRDIATFSSFYFLGDYVAKGIATFLEHKNKHKGVHLINRLKEAPGKDANVFKKFWHWAKHTSLKSSDELKTIEDKRLRTICQIGNIVFSLLSLGVFIPIYTRSKTNKKHAEELAKLNAEKNANSASNAAASSASGSTDAAGISSTDEFSKALIKDNTAFKSFFNS
ncbi:unknown [Fusobacterium sp. CAG:439]|nr:unknown [Fusobacterium sp. CAG:439]